MKLRHFLSPITLTLVLGACTDSFDSLNISPNNPQRPDVASLFANVQHKAALNTANEGWLRGNVIAQLTTVTVAPNDVALYTLDANQAYWQQLYALVRDCNSVIADAKTNQRPSTEAAALVMRAFLFAQLTDLWGDVPFKQAVQARADVLQPAYDTQQTVYTDATDGMLASLRQANELLKTTQAPVLGDMYFGGSTAKWRKLANSLRLRYLLRISAKADVSAEMQQIIAGEPVFDSNADEAGIAFLATAPDKFINVDARQGDHAQFRLTQALATQFNQAQDPRASVLFRPNAANAIGGIAPTEPSKISSTQLNAASLTGTIFREEYGKVALRAVLMPYAELQFVLAEAAQRKLITTGVSRTYYENGIRANFSSYGVTGVDAYIARVPLTDATALEQIISQKWVASFNTGYEGWFDYRRTGFPTLTAGADNRNSGQIARRFLYPTDEQVLNKTSLDAAIARIGGNTYNTKGWWDK